MADCIRVWVKYTIVFLITFSQDAFTLNIKPETPKHQRIQAGFDMANFTCKSNSSIDKCEFKIWDGYNNKELQLFIGNNLTNDWLQGSSGIFSVRSFDTDLKNGLCGITVKGKFPHYQYVVGCRTESPGEDWSYRYSTLYITKNTGKESAGLDLSMSPTDAMYATAASVVNMTCSTTLANGKCYFQPGPGRRVWSNKTGHTCGASVRVTEENNGMIWCRETVGGNENNILDVVGTSISSFQPPTNVPDLELKVMRFRENYTMVTNEGIANRFKVGDYLTATCTVMESRPPADITWYIGTKVAGADDVQEVPSDGWRWSWTALTRMQILRKRLGKEDLTETIQVTCSVSHKGMSWALNTTQTIDLRAPPADSVGLLVYVCIGFGVVSVLSLVTLIFTYNNRRLQIVNRIS